MEYQLNDVEYVKTVKLSGYKTDVQVTINLKIGKITMQRKGGDNGRETAKMLQFKINPAELFETIY